MTEPGAQYDHIGSKYDEYARTATLKRAESYTFLRMVGALAGQRVLDLACGFWGILISPYPPLSSWRTILVPATMARSLPTAMLRGLQPKPQSGLM
jgi:hypothetical protein